MSSRLPRYTVDLQYLTSYLVHFADGVEDISKSSLFYYVIYQFIIDKLYSPQNVQPNCSASGFKVTSYHLRQLSDQSKFGALTRGVRFYKAFKYQILNLSILS